MPVAFDQVLGLRSLLNIGLVLLCIFGFFGLFGEMFKLLARRPADFTGFGIKFVVTAIAMVAIPLVSSAVAKLVLMIADAFFDGGGLDAMSAAFQTALGAGCDDYEWYEVIPIAFSMQGVLLGLTWVVITIALIIKYMVIDLAWPVIYAIEVYLGVLTIPLSFLTNQDALRPYMTRVLSVAIWPIVYAVLFILIASTLPQAVALAGENGDEVLWGCDDLVVSSSSTELREGMGQVPRNDAGVPVPDIPSDAAASNDAERELEEQSNRAWLLVRILGGIALYMVLVFKVPAISGRILGVPGAPGLTDIVGTAVKATKGRL